MTGFDSQPRNALIADQPIAMLSATFHRLIPGISPNAEQRLWRHGILTWSNIVRKRDELAAMFPALSRGQLTDVVQLHSAALAAEDVEHFARILRRPDYYRIALAFPTRTLFLDIETTGLSRTYDYITMVGWAYKGEYGAFIRGASDLAFRQALADARVVVTFNGTLFDLPFLRDAAPDLPIPAVHVDLRYLARRVGLTGGQKVIERTLGVGDRSPGNIRDGAFAPVLWHRYRRGDLASLRSLVEYNHSDVEGMKVIFDATIERFLKAGVIPSPLQTSISHFGRPTRLRWAAEGGEAPGRASGVRIAAYTGTTAPPITLGALASGRMDHRIVGIDLTGSEDRASGWCLLADRIAHTRQVKTDDELVELTVEARPRVVSIDSPLSLPQGRKTVFDNDPTRHRYGIVRDCERELRRRGINVYPALLPSMQRLTERGIRLASRLRLLGVPVIESYPGAAQDIMGIPRKGASLEMLRDGLVSFGVHGTFANHDVSHDELDAITSAVVGAFFLAGRFESLGTFVDEALIIPEVRLPSGVWGKRTIVGVSGPVAAGKTTAAKTLEDCGFHYTRYSAVLATLMRRAGKRVTRSTLQEFGDSVHRRKGQRWLGRELLKSLPHTGNIVVDGLRFPEDHAFLKESFGADFLHLFIDASRPLRMHRFNSRRPRSGTFLAADSHRVEGHVAELRDIADAVIANPSTLADFRSEILRFIEREPNPLVAANG